MIGWALLVQEPGLPGAGLCNLEPPWPIQELYTLRCGQVQCTRLGRASSYPRATHPHASCLCKLHKTSVAKYTSSHCICIWSHRTGFFKTAPGSTSFASQHREEAEGCEVLGRGGAGNGAGLGFPPEPVKGEINKPKLRGVIF